MYSDNRYKPPMPPQTPQQAIVEGIQKAANINKGMPPTNNSSTQPLMSDQKVESSTEALASGVEKSGGDGKASYTVEEGNKYTGDYQKEKVDYKK